MALAPMEEKKLGSDELARLAADIRCRVRELDGSRPPGNVHFVALADFFRYNVHKGGFAQLIFNLQGEYLEEMEQMLLHAPAPVAHTFYLKAVETCLGDEEGYRAFVAGDYVSANRVKDALHAVTLEYYEKRKKFVEEVGPFVERTRYDVENWLLASKPG